MKEKSQNIETANKHNEEQKNTVKMKKDAEHAAKLYCRTCKNVISPVFQCSCSGGVSDDNEEESDLTSVKTSSAQKKDILNHQISASNFSDKHSDAKNLALIPRSKMTVLVLIADLVKNKLLTIENNEALCTLTIKCDPEKLTELQKNAVTAYAEMLKKELSDFLNKHVVSNNSYFIKEVKDAQGYILSLSINIPNAKLYHQFIEYVNANELLPIKAMVPNDTPKTNNNPGNKLLNPFRTELKP